MENQFEFCPDSQIGRREFRRRRTNLPCILRFGGRQLSGTLLDISEAGAKVASPARHPNSPVGSLLVADREIPVRIVWEENGSIGVRFDDMPTDIINEIAKKSGRD